MKTKQNISKNKERVSANQQAELVLKNIKEKKGDVVLIAISNKTTIELPAHLSQTERNARVANYIKLYKSKKNPQTL